MATIKTKFRDNEHKNWLVELNTMQDELKLYQDKLAYLAALYFTTEKEKAVNNLRRDVLEFFYQIDELRYMIHLHEVFLTEEAENGKIVEEDHQTEMEKLACLKKDFEVLKSKTESFYIARED